MLSIIIPTLNEENYLPMLLRSIKKQGFSNYEIIVADANSSDKTVEIAEEYNCKIISGGLPGKGRNNGAKIAKGELFLFLDADAVMPDDFLKESLKEFRERKLGLASYSLLPHQSRLARLALNIFYNKPIIFMEKIFPHGAMGILIKKEIFEKLNGFDEEIKLAEDHDLIRRAAKLGENFGILRSSKIFISDRRFKTDGWIRTGLKFLLCEGHMIFFGPVKSDIFKYKFNHYPPVKELKSKKDK